MSVLNISLQPQTEPEAQPFIIVQHSSTPVGQIDTTTVPSLIHWLVITAYNLGLAGASCDAEQRYLSFSLPDC